MTAAACSVMVKVGGMETRDETARSVLGNVAATGSARMAGSPMAPRRYLAQYGGGSGGRV